MGVFKICELTIMIGSLLEQYMGHIIDLGVQITTITALIFHVSLDVFIIIKYICFCYDKQIQISLAIT